MKQIEPVTVWSNGQEVQATILNAYVVGDNLKSEATFTYAIGNASNDTANLMVTLVGGTITMTGQAYVDYQTNQYAWDWVATKLNLTIVGEYPGTTTTTTTI